MEVLQSRKGKDIIYYAGYMYRQDKVRINVVTWRCSKDKCKGRLTTPLRYREDPEGAVESGHHSHPPDPAAKDVRKVENEVKRRAIDTHDPPRRIVQLSLGVASEEVAQRVGSGLNLAETVRRKRRREEDLPPNPARIEDVRIPPFLRRTLDGEEFLLYDGANDGENAMLIFTTAAMLQLLVDNDTWMADGTFKVAPAIFYQVYTIHVVLRGNVVPVVYVLLKRKTADMYQAMWSQLRNLNDRLRPSMIQIDFEHAAMVAIQRVFPDAVVTGCYFHLGQSVWRRIASLGLKEAYTTNPVIRKYTRILLALAFLPPREIANGFGDILDQEDFPRELEPVFDYFEDTYIGRPVRNRRRAPTFATCMWSVRERHEQGLPRTNNQLEAWHNAFQGGIQCSHPTLFKFIKYLQEEQALVERNITQIRQGRDLTTRLKRYQALNRRLTRIIEHPPPTPIEFLNAIAGNLEINIV